jgi:murein DD-endopeptidase MepM/ murein hydrolase activator NlpD
MHAPIAKPVQHPVTPHPRHVFAVRAGRSTAVLALLGLSVAATGAAFPTPAEPTAAPVSIVAEPAMAGGSDEEQTGFGAPDVGLPRFVGEGLPEETADLAAEVQAAASLVAPSTYEATTPEELAEARREARLKLVRAAIAAGIPVDLAGFADDLDLSQVGQLAWPVSGGGSITDVFGARGGRHMGLDIAAASGTPIGAAAPGIVILSSEGYFGYGVAVMILHVDGMVTLYGHMVHGSRVVDAGDWVETGAPIGLVGNTGRSFGPHLHFEVRVGGVPVDPLGYLGGSSKRPDIKGWTPKDVPAPGQPAALPEDPTPTPTPSSTPSGTPTPSPSGTPTGTPTPSPSGTPTGTPTPSPTGTPTVTPTPTPTPTPSGTPSGTPTPSTSPTPTSPAPTTPAPTTPAPAPTTPPATSEPTPTSPAPSPSTSTSAPAPAPTTSTTVAPTKASVTTTPTPTEPAPTPTSTSVVGSVVDSLL